MVRIFQTANLQQFRSLIFLIGFFLLLTVFVLNNIYVKPACSCGTINDSVSGELNKINALLLTYSSDHQGQYPTFETLQAIVSSADYFGGNLTNGKYVVDRKPTLSIKDAGQIDYTVSSAGDKYVLIGIGSDEKFIDINFLGFRYRKIIGYDFPVLTSTKE